MMKAAVAAACVLIATVAASGRVERTPLHFAPNHNFDAGGRFLPAQAGFNLADLSDAGRLPTLPPGVKALVWLGLCGGVDPIFLKTLAPYLGKGRLFGFYLMDDPDPRLLETAVGGVQRCRAEDLKAESDWIHAHLKGSVTFIVLMNLSRSATPSFAGTYNPENSHVDLFGIDPYPCRSETSGCDLAMIDRYVAAAESFGIPRSRIVPVFQAFGGGTWDDGDGGRYLLPDPAQLRSLVARWRGLVPAPAFDYAYSWGSQRGAQTLQDAPDLQALFAERNGVAGPR